MKAATTSKRTSSNDEAPRASKRIKATGAELEGEGSSSSAAPIPKTYDDDELYDLECQTMGETWYKALSSEFSKPYFIKLKEFLATERKSNTVYPALKDVYSWSRLTPLHAVKAIVIGQDPYHDVNQAHGLAFSVLPPTKPPPSLKNIYKQLQSDFPGFVPPPSGDLTALAQAGVLFLNTSLTVRAHKAGSHSNKGWETFTGAVLKAILNRKTVQLGAASEQSVAEKQSDDADADDAEAEQADDTVQAESSDASKYEVKVQGDKGVVIFAWGLPAQKTCAKIGIDSKKHLLLKSAHPSPLSANKGFLGNGHFKKANEWLELRYGKSGVIDWSVISGSGKK